MDFNPLMLLAGNLTSIIQGCREEGLEKCEREREVKTEREKGREGIGEGKEREKEAEMYFSECFPHAILPPVALLSLIAICGADTITPINQIKKLRLWEEKQGLRGSADSSTQVLWGTQVVPAASGHPAPAHSLGLTCGQRGWRALPLAETPAASPLDSIRTLLLELKKLTAIFKSIVQLLRQQRG